MSSYQLTQQAVEDLFEIWSYIAADDIEAANRVEAAIYDACAQLADTPLPGRSRRPHRFAATLLARATLSQLLDSVRPGEKTAARHSNYSLCARYSAKSEMTTIENRAGG
jgi:plasmid stabilization system protein ParE